MFERYTEKARRVIFFARQEACELGGSAIEPHHILLALIREDLPLLARFAIRTLPTLAHNREKIRESTGLRERLSASVDMPLSPQAKQVLIYAAEESEQLNHEYLSTEHLLLGLLRGDESVSLEILSEYGIDIKNVRDGLREVTKGKAIVGKAGNVVFNHNIGTVAELKTLAADARYLAMAMVKKAERIEAICAEFTEYSVDRESDDRQSEN